MNFFSDRRYYESFNPVNADITTYEPLIRYKKTNKV